MKISRDVATTIAVFLTLVFALNAVGIWLIFRLRSATPLMLSVGLAAILTCLLTNRDLRSLGWSWARWKYEWLSYFLPLGYIAAAYGFIWTAGLGGWYDLDFVLEQKEAYDLSTWSNTGIILLHFILSATVSFMLLLPGVLGEELGWRGLLVPELFKVTSFTGVALISGLIWAIWHWPLMLLGLYGNETTPLTYQFFFFTSGLISMSVIMAYIRLRAHSVWPAVIFHMSHNVFLQKFFGPMTLENSKSDWYVDEFGVVLPITVLFVALIFWRKGQREFDAAET